VTAKDSAFGDLFGGNNPSFQQLMDVLFGVKPAPQEPEKQSNHDSIKVYGVPYQRCTVRLGGPISWGHLDDLAASGRLFQRVDKPGQPVAVRRVRTELFRSLSLGYVRMHASTFYEPR
jgi:hypothetical protein